MSAENPQIERHRHYLKTPGVRQQIFAQFAPVFCFHSQEQHFPTHPDDFVQNVIEVKHAEYTKREAQNLLTPEEFNEFDIIKKYFWKDEAFNPQYKDNEGKADFKAMMGIEPKGKSKFLVFDEKKYGYRVGEKIQVAGVYPPDHPRYDSTQAAAPIAASIMPTEEGFYLSFEYTYALNNAIKGTRWLRDLLPSKWADKLDNCGLHYGDCEGIGMYIKVDDQGVASLKSIQTFAHGRDGAREVPVAQCTYRDHRPCIYVGLGGHPSYTDNFVGRNRFVDVVGDTYHITPTLFNDISFDKLAEKSDDMFPAWCTFPRLADSNPMAFSRTSCPKDAADLIEQSKEWHRYKPVLFLTRAWHWLRKKIQEKLLGRVAEPPIPPQLELVKQSTAVATITSPGSQPLTPSADRSTIERPVVPTTSTLPANPDDALLQSSKPKLDS